MIPTAARLGASGSAGKPPEVRQKLRAVDGAAAKVHRLAGGVSGSSWALSENLGGKNSKMP